MSETERAGQVSQDQCWPLLVDGKPAITDAMARMAQGLCKEIKGKTNIKELAWLYNLASHAPDGPLVDLGTYYGRSAAMLAQTGRGVITIDTYQEGPDAQDPGKGPRPQPARVMAYLAGWPNIWPVAMDLVEAAQSISRGPGGYIWPRPALIFLDADHRLQPMRAALQAWSPLLVDGGIFAIHDYGSERWPQVKEATDEILSGAQGWQVIGQIRYLLALTKRGCDGH